MRVAYWSLPPVLCELQYVRRTVVKFLLWLWLPLQLEHRCSELRVYLGRFFLWWIWSVLPYFFENFRLSNFLRKRQTDFQSGCTSLQSHQKWMSVPLSPHHHQHMLSLEFLILALLTGVRLNFRVVFICISLMMKDVEHFFRCFSAIRYSSGRNLCSVLSPIF